MIARRRAANSTGSPSHSPAESGPRCSSAALIARSAPTSPDAIPQMPHTSLAAQQPAGDEHQRLREDRQVEADRAVGDVLEIVDELLRPGHLPREPQLGESRDPWPDDEPLPIARDAGAQL